jgi:RNA polymerase sigma factor (sigma-70 family)
MVRSGREVERDRRLLRAAQRGDRRARDLVVTSHLQLVRGVASRYRNLGLPLDDLVQEGVVGLLDAIGRYDPAAGDFERFARFRVRRAIRNALTDQSRLVRLPKHVVERRRALARAANGRAQSPAALAAVTGLPVRAVADALTAELTLTALDALDAGGADPAATDPETAVLAHEVAGRLDLALTHLTNRQRQIVCRTFGLDAPPERISALAAEFGLSRERTRSILRDALDDLRTALDDPDG